MTEEEVVVHLKEIHRRLELLTESRNTPDSLVGVEDDLDDMKTLIQDFLEDIA